MKPFGWGVPLSHHTRNGQCQSKSAWEIWALCPALRYPEWNKKNTYINPVTKKNSRSVSLDAIFYCIISPTLVHETFVAWEALIWILRPKDSPALLMTFPEGLKLMSRSEKKRDDSEKMVQRSEGAQTFLLLTIELCSRLALWWRQLMRDSGANTTLFCNKESSCKKESLSFSRNAFHFRATNTAGVKKQERCRLVSCR